MLLHVLCWSVVAHCTLGATNYNVGDGHYRRETQHPNGDIRGQYSYVDPTGKTILVNYSAGKNGFQVEEDAPNRIPISFDYATSPAPPAAAQYQTFPQVYRTQAIDSAKQQFRFIPVQPTAEPRSYNVFEDQKLTATDLTNDHQRFFPVPAGFRLPSQIPTEVQPSFSSQFAPKSSPEQFAPFGQPLFVPASPSERAASARQFEQFQEELRNETLQSSQVRTELTRLESAQFAAPQRVISAEDEVQYRLVPSAGPQQFPSNEPTSEAADPQQRFVFLPAGLKSPGFSQALAFGGSPTHRE